MRSRNLSNKNIFAICRFLDNWRPKNQVEQRDKQILLLAYEFDMTARSIAKMNVFRGCGNRSHNLLGEASVARIINSYALEDEKRIEHTKKRDYERRKSITLKKYYGDYDGIEKKCAKCGAKRELELHHIKPISQGGNDEPENMQYLCKKCHKKLHLMPLEFI